MIRRRRRVREIPFSFDSFLDIVANVVGIIIRLILVAWLGARSYSSIQPALKTARENPQAVEQKQDSSDPLQATLAEHRRALAEAQKRLLVKLQELHDLQSQQTETKGKLLGLISRRQEFDRQQQSLRQSLEEQEKASQKAALTSAELRRRCQQLAEEIRQLEQQPPVKQVLRYRTPVSRPVLSEELFFECRQGRVAFIDIAALLSEVRAGLDEKSKLLRTRWQVEDSTRPVGAFRLHYVIERERELLDAIGGQGAPEASGTFRYGLSEWQLEPITPNRGETLQAALADGSEFRQVAGAIDPQHTAVTFWVYPDSFDLFRRLRDLLYERDVVVAGRPLPEGKSIASSRRGSLSRGQ